MTRDPNYDGRVDETDYRNLAAFIAAQAHLAPFGITVTALNPQATKAELLQCRADLRRGCVAIRDRSETLIKEGKLSEAQDLCESLSTVSTMIERINNLLDNKELDESMSPNASHGQRRGSGSDARVLGPKDKLASLPGHDAAYAHSFGFGDYVRAMVVGTNDVAIRNSLSEGTDSAGGYTVPTRLMGQVIDTMRAQMVVVKAGAVTVPLDTQKTAIARMASDPAAGWRVENGALAESDPTFEKVEFTARSLAVLVKVSRELLEDSINLNDALTRAFAGSMAVEVDRVALFGTGTAPEPRGVFNTTGIGVVSMGTNGAQLLNWGKVLDTVLELKNTNSEDATAMVMAPRTWRTVAGFVDTTGQPLRAPADIDSVPRLVSTNVPIAQTHGTAVNASTIIVGDFSQLMLGVRTMVRIEVLRERFAENHQYAFVAHLRMDVQLARPKAFAALKGITP